MIAMESRDKVRVTLYVRGQKLDPDTVTKLLGADPTWVQRDGDVQKLPSGNQAVSRTGLWEKTISTDGGNIEDMLNLLLSEVAPSISLIPTLANVTGAYFDVFVARSIDAAGQPDVLLSLDSKTLAALAAAGIPIQMTIAAVPSAG